MKKYLTLFVFFSSIAFASEEPLSKRMDRLADRIYCKVMSSNSGPEIPVLLDQANEDIEKIFSTQETDPADCKRAFFGSAKVGDATTIRIFLNHGCDPNARDEAGRTPAMAAANNGNHETLKALFGAGANGNARCHKSKSIEDYVPTLQTVLLAVGTANPRMLSSLARHTASSYKLQVAQLSDDSSAVPHPFSECLELIKEHQPTSNNPE